MLRAIKKTAISIGKILFAPIRALMELGEWVGASARSGAEMDSDEQAESTWVRLLLWPIRAVAGTGRLLLQVIAFPFRAMAVDPRRRKRLLLGLPALSLLLATCVLLSNAWSSKRSTEARYVSAMDGAEADGELKEAQRFAYRMVRQGTRAVPEVSFRYCKLLAADKELERANAIIEVLAPNDAIGYPPAHEQRAIAYANLVARGASVQILPTLLWHLNQAGDRNTEPLLLAWATYYRASNQIDMCIRAVESAARLNPVHAFGLADLYAVKGDSTNVGRAMAYARDEYRRQLAKDPLSTTARIQLAQSLVRLGQLDEADQTIRAGLELLPGNMDLERVQTGLELARYERSSQAGKSEDERLSELQMIMDKLEDPTVVFDRMIKLYNASNQSENRQKIRQVLEEQAAQNPSLAILQFALSVIAILENRTNDAIALLEKTLELDPKLHLAKNNLSWLLSEQSPPQLDRALTLAEEAVAAAPAVPNYRDTLGNVLFLKEDYERAVTELERALALPGMTPESRPKVHAKLAESYKQLGNEELAALHASRSGSQNP